MVKHTPKPWTCTPGRDYCSQFDIWDKDGMEVQCSNAEREANARLIAAAPDLLEALESLYHTANSIGEDTCDPVAFAGALEDARAAIAKARGQE